VESILINKDERENQGIDKFKNCPTQRALDGWESAPFLSFINAQAESCSRSFVHARPPASTDYCSCQVLRENHFSCDFPSVTGPKTKSVDRDLALRAYFFILQDDLFHI
jgi:hypothetical protein